MDFILFLIIIFVPIGWIIKLSDINNKIERNKYEDITNFESFIFNLTIGIANVFSYFYKIVWNFIIPFMVCFIPLEILLLYVFSENISESIYIISLGVCFISLVFVCILNVIRNKKSDNLYKNS